MDKYIKDVLSGKLLASNKIKLACERHENDLKKVDFPYYFDEGEADKAIKFMELLPSTDGKPIQVLGFQKFIIGSLYGWREKETKNRRFNRAFISLAAKKPFSRGREKGKHDQTSSFNALVKRFACERSALARVSNQSATSPKPSSRAVLAMPGYMSVYSWVSPAIAVFRFSRVAPNGKPVAGSPHCSRYSRCPCAWPVSPSAVERNTAATSF